MSSIWKGDKELQALFKRMSADAPKATAYALTGLAFDIRKETQNALPRWVRLTRPFLQQSVVYVPARASRLEAQVGFAPRANFAKLLEEGGTRKPAKRAIAVPTENVRRTGKGGISGSQRPAALMQRKGVFSGVPAGVDAAKAGIWSSTKRLGLRMLYFFAKTTRYHGGDIKFVKTAERVYRANAQQKFRDAISKMLSR